MVSQEIDDMNVFRGRDTSPVGGDSVRPDNDADMDLCCRFPIARSNLRRYDHRYHSLTAFLDGRRSATPVEC